MKKSNSIQLITNQGYQQGSININEIEQIIHPGLTLEKRLREIDRITQLESEGFATRKANIEKQLRDIRYLPIKRLFSPEEINNRIKDNLNKIEENVSEFDYAALFVYLVTEGRIGEDYDDYTSYFHKGATTRADREFVQRFNKDDETGHCEKIDNPSEILLILEDGVFGKPQGFNVTLVDHVLGSSSLFQKSLVVGLRMFTGESFKFLQTYYLEGKHVERLLRMLIKNWDGFLTQRPSPRTHFPT